MNASRETLQTLRSVSDSEIMRLPRTFLFESEALRTETSDMLLKARSIAINRFEGIADAISPLILFRCDCLSIETFVVYSMRIIRFCCRIFVNRSLHLENIKFYGFDMDYTLAGKSFELIHTCHAILYSRL